MLGTEMGASIEKKEGLACVFANMLLYSIHL
jgi:hypothetical protein